MSSLASSVPKSQTMSLCNWGILLLLSLLWGGSFFFNGVAIKELPVFTIVYGRVFFAAVLLIIFMKLKGIPFPKGGSILLAFLFMGFINNFVPFSLIVAGQAHISSGLASVLNATTPLFTAVVAHFATNDPSERLDAKRITGILLGITGVAILLSPKIGAVGFSANEVLGQLAVLGAGLAYGVAVVFGRRFGQLGISPVASATGQVTATSILMLPIVLYVDRPWEFISSVSLEASMAILGIALFSTAIAYILYFELIKTAGATNATLVTLVIPVSAMMLGVVFLDEIITPHIIGGMLAIGLGLLVIDGRFLKLFHKKSPV